MLMVHGTSQSRDKTAVTKMLDDIVDRLISTGDGSGVLRTGFERKADTEVERPGHRREEPDPGRHAEAESAPGPDRGQAAGVVSRRRRADRRQGISRPGRGPGDGLSQPAESGALRPLVAGSLLGNQAAGLSGLRGPAGAEG